MAQALVPYGTRVRYTRQGESLVSPSSGEGVFLGAWEADEPCWSVRRTENSVVVLYPERGDTVEPLVEATV